MQLPHELRQAIDAELERYPVKALARAVTELSDRYRSRDRATGGSFLGSPEDVAAYAAFRLPATFAAIHSCLTQVHERTPHWSPETLLDAGAGPGSATWAALAVWSNVQHVSMLERDPHMTGLGKRLAARAPSAALRDAQWIAADLTSTWETSPHDLVIAAYVVGELSPRDATHVVQKLWERTRGALVLIEPGTPVGFQQVARARSELLAVGAHIVAPCPHGDGCPMVGDDWCHFAQRVERSRLHRQVKGGELSYEDEKFSFVCFARTPVSAAPGRVVRHPQVRKGHIRLEVCAPGGLTTVDITRKDKDAFRRARNTRWGSVAPIGPDGNGDA